MKKDWIPMESCLFIAKMSHRVRGSQAANQMKSVFCGGVYAAKNTLRVVECRSHAYGLAKTQRTFFIKKGRRPF